MTAADPGKPGSFRLFLCTAVPEEIAVEPEKDVALIPKVPGSKSAGNPL